MYFCRAAYKSLGVMWFKRKLHWGAVFVILCENLPFYVQVISLYWKKCGVVVYLAWFLPLFLPIHISIIWWFMIYHMIYHSTEQIHQESILFENKYSKSRVSIQTEVCIIWVKSCSSDDKALIDFSIRIPYKSIVISNQIMLDCQRLRTRDGLFS